MAKIVLEYSASKTLNGVTTVTDPSLLANAAISWYTAIPTYSLEAGSVRVGGPSANIDGEWLSRSDTAFFILGSQNETRGLLGSFTRSDFYFKFDGYDFDYAKYTFPSGLTIDYNELIGRVILTKPTSGIITSFEYGSTYSSGALSSPEGSYSNSRTIGMTVTDISISAAEIDYGRYQGIIPSVFTGNDQIFGSIAGDIIQAGTGNDEVYGYEGNDRIFGDEGNDFLNGENGNDQLFGGDGNDWLNGGAGNDWIVGGAGYDASVGGDGDDGVVFDAGDNLAATTGGAGYDILFVNEADTASALTFNLAAQGFEQAIISRTDTTNQAWVTNTNIYDTAWRLVKSEYINDNGTSDVYRFDPANTVSWSRIQSHYSADNTLDWEIIVNDDGSTKLLDFDINNTAVWYSRIWTQDAQGNTISDSFVLDAALAQRSNEVNAIAKKIFIDDGLI